MTVKLSFMAILDNKKQPEYKERIANSYKVQCGHRKSPQGILLSFYLVWDRRYYKVKTFSFSCLLAPSLHGNKFSIKDQILPAKCTEKGEKTKEKQTNKTTTTAAKTNCIFWQLKSHLYWRFCSVMLPSTRSSIWYLYF